MRWRKRADDGSGGEFLSAPESTLSDFGHSGGDGFAEAWRAQEHADDGTSSDDALAPLTDKRSVRARDLDRRSPGVYVLAAVCVLSVAGVVVAVQQGVFESDEIGLGPDEAPPGEIISIGDPRVYTGLDEQTGPVGVRHGTAISQRFTATGGADPRPGDLLSEDDSAHFGSVLWGGRVHVVVIGPDLNPANECIVVSLVADDLRPVDLAAHGPCPEQYTATGDRTACADDGIVLLEVWPFDPDAVVEQPDVDALRVRIESATDTDTIESVRGSAFVDESFVAELSAMHGRPGDAVEIGIAGQAASCTLIDRAEIMVQLL